MLLDTDVFIDILRDDPDAMFWLTRQVAMPFLSGVSALEAAFGTQSMKELRDVHGAIARFDVLWPEPGDVAYATRSLATIKLSHGLGALDAVTAAIAIRHNLPVVTLNIKHFRAIPGVKVVRPYMR